MKPVVFSRWCGAGLGADADQAIVSQRTVNEQVNVVRLLALCDGN